METLQLETPRLTLALNDTQAMLARIDALAAEDRAEVSAAWLEQLVASEPSAWMHGFGIVERASGQVVGTCGYKGAPDPSGCVEIAYEIDTAMRGRGFGKEATDALVQYAFGSGATTVCAHTLAMASASTSVLDACGFTWMGDVIDPEDGPVWRWERTSRVERVAG